MSDPEKNRLQGLDYKILQQCMHCGMCLPTCPTFDTTGRERNSPRGRIALMRAIADGELKPSRSFAEEMYYCLGCLACETACPAGVDYATMFETARAEIEEKQLLRSRSRSFWRALLLKGLFMRPRMLRFAGSLLRIQQSLKIDRFLRNSGLTKLLPKKLRDLEPMTPRIQAEFSDQKIKAVELPEKGSLRYRVGFLTGCVQDLAFSDINRDTVDVLLANGCAVETPRMQGCCGSLHAHNGEIELAKTLARRLIDSFRIETLDAIISNAGGCGSHLRHFSKILSQDSDYIERAKLWDAKLKDIHEWLAAIDMSPLPPLPKEIDVTYHPSCHLSHGQGVRIQPIQLLRSIPNLTLKELPEADWCCGSAGIYNITQPEEAAKLMRRKAMNIEKTGCKVVATSNPGCHLQLQTGLSDNYEICHPVSLLAKAYRSARKPTD